MWLHRRLIDALGRKKEASATDVMATNLKRCLTSFDVTLLGIGHMLGSGIYVLSPSIARNTTGPALIVSYLIAGLASLLAALAYADFGVRYPRSGSAYSYVYYSIGEFWAFFVGWNVILENVLATAACASACSSYVDSLAGYAVSGWLNSVIGRLRGPGDNDSSSVASYFNESPDVLAFVILAGFIAFMSFGVRATSGLNNVLVTLNLAVLAVVVGVGAYYADFDNWKYQPDNPKFNSTSQPNFINGFLPYGWNGVLKASASCFFAYVGFDAIAASGEEALNPQKSLPIATLASMAVVTTAYVLVAAVLTLMMYFADISPTSGLPAALRYHHAFWAQYIVSVGAIAGMFTVIMATVFAMARVAYAMADDGLLFSAFATVQKRSQIPVVSMYFWSLAAGIAALLLTIDTLIEMLSIGTLFAYLIVSCALLISKYTPLDVAIEFQLESVTGSPKSTESPHLFTVYPVADSNALIGTAASGTIDSLTKIDAADGDRQSLRIHQLKPAFRFVGCLLPADYGQRQLVIVTLVMTFVATLVACFTVRYGLSWGAGGDAGAGLDALAWIVIGLCIATLGVCALLIFAHEIPGNANAPTSQYNMPLVPLLPMLSVIVNATLMATLEVVTWLRLVVWIMIGLAIYFGYGIRNSKLSQR